MRDDFNEPLKRIVAQRVGYCCSNPGCRASTTGPQIDPTKALNLGVACHITAASPGGPRYDPSLSPEKRGAIDNAIWLCQSCAKLIDNDESRFTEEELRSWRMEAEAAALRVIGQRIAIASSASDTFIETYADQGAPLRLNCFVYAGTAKYPKGSIVGGIQWTDDYVDVRVTLYNRASETLSDVDLYLEMDTYIAAIGQLTNVPDLFISSAGRMASVWLEGTDAGQQNIALPLLPAGPTISPTYRVYCPKLLPKCELVLVLASLAINPALDGVLPEQLFAPRRLPKVINIRGIYNTTNLSQRIRYHVIEEKVLTQQYGLTNP